jgi:TonB family protein
VEAGFFKLKFSYAVGASVFLHGALAIGLAMPSMRGEVRNAAAPRTTQAIQARVLALPSSAIPMPVSSELGLSPPAAALAIQSTQAPNQSTVAAALAQPSPNFKGDKAAIPAPPLGKTTPLSTSTIALAVPAALPPLPAIASHDGIKDSVTLDSRPQLLSNVVIEYPLNANNREGIVTLELTLAIGGKVDHIEVLKATPSGFFESAAMKGFQGAQFTPGLFQGLGVKARLIVEVEFMPTNRGGSVAGPK